MDDSKSKPGFNEKMRKRTKAFALNVIQIVEGFGNNSCNRIIKDQLIRSACSVGSNYRAACRARSKAEFYSKLSITVEECDETIYWLELILEYNHQAMPALITLINEANEILAILATARKTLSNNK